MAQRIVVIQGHPDPDPARLCRALADAYAAGAERGGHAVRRLDVSALALPVLLSRKDWEAPPPDEVRRCQDDIAWAGHIVIVYPLWLGGMPALLKGFLEQVMRPGFAVAAGDGAGGRKLLTGRSARIVVTMGMPALVYRWFFGAHSLKSLERNILRFCGIAPVRESLFGMVEAASLARRTRWLTRMSELGRRAR